MSFDLELTRLAGIAIVVNVLARRARRRGGFAAPSDDEWQKELGLNLMPAVRLDRALLLVDARTRVGRQRACHIDSACARPLQNISETAVRTKNHAGTRNSA
ncbi:hypothetical protein L0Z19_25155 [Burkholderia multivorans]|nr:hypothetical protein [Burkholderia multivorans]MCL4649845.1 hypothetical protein [Burkholderia multivorans]MCL4658707.1 hypothetical protein [Burkholderia multivorans]MCO1424629.1 hypothetical protein [Burkholderia multivorans]UQN54812.1 hypothetical protein L0Y88_25060 [Burkholderia multivorans]UQN80262.1 hypothetical protein L0Z18_11700 [Burkholderia multivorans]